MIDKFNVRNRIQKNVISFFNTVLYKIMDQKNVNIKKINECYRISEKTVEMFLENFTHDMNIKCVALPFEVAIGNKIFDGIFDFIIKGKDTIRIGLFDFNELADLNYYRHNFMYSLYKDGFEKEFDKSNIISIYNVPLGKFFNFNVSGITHNQNLKKIANAAEI